MNFVVKRNKLYGPVLAHIPHSSRYIPATLRSSFVLSKECLAIELTRMTDSYTDHLFSRAKFHGVVFINRLSRLVMDPERFMDDKKEIMSKRGMGAIYTKTSSGDVLRNPVNELEKKAILDKYYKPYHDQFSFESTALLRSYGRCLILDGHSFPSKPLPYELDQNMRRPDICIGTDAFHTPAYLARKSVQFFRKKGLSVSVNMPFSGCMVPVKYYKKNKAVSSIMVEINRKLYLNEKTGQRALGYRRVKSLLDEYINEVTSVYLDAYPENIK